MEQVVTQTQARLGGRALRAAVIAPGRGEVIAACGRAVAAGLIAPAVIGDFRQIARAEADAGCTLGGIRRVEAATAEEAARTAARMAAAGEIDLVIRGGDAPDILRVLLAEGAGLVRPGGTAAHVAMIKPEKYARAFLLTDALAHPQPDLKLKAALIETLVRVGRRVGIETPRVAVLAAVEVVYPQMPVTLEAAVLSKMAERGQIKGAHVDGPLSFDCAVDPAAAESKGIRNSAVAGRADAMLAPNIETAQGVYKAMALCGRAQMGGVLVGGRVPVAMPLAGDGADTVFYSIVLACAVG
ncbi:MAG TPA: phosphate acyltransferase [candidate division Zixibacteria bacterium]|nr:phosphate butyryltransferase [candidate division Zixibacteria bacterium]MDD4918106.1 phosphate acyltransferase [candidate division Zixibacteria bacterium]MDM7972025.1 phosphate acyltransferase [candidate division Zixibacteria bacterium]HPM37376.1 phosphate acyltransferase [candidate division Zixibacteria bacterium]